MPKVGRPETPRTNERTRAGPTPIGVPSPWWTTRRPDIALPGEVPLTPSTTARTSQSSTIAPATIPTTVQTSSDTYTTVTIPTTASNPHARRRSTANAVKRRSSWAIG